MSSIKGKRIKLSDSIHGILMMLIQAFAMAIVYNVSKILTHSMHPHQVTFLYKATVLILILPWCILQGIKKTISTKKLGTHVARGTFSIMGSLCFMHAIHHLNVIDAVAITYLEHIIIVLIGVLYFGEKAYYQKFIFVIMSFIGALLITAPGFHKFNTYYIFLFLALIFWAVNNCAIKVLGKTEHTKTQLFYVMLISSMLSLPLALAEWKPIHTQDLGLLFLLAISYLIHVIGFFKAFKYADISVVMPFDYVRLIFTGLVGYLMLNEAPESYYSYCGYGMITIAGIYYIHFETGKSKNSKKDDKSIGELESKYEQV